MPCWKRIRVKELWLKFCFFLHVPKIYLPWSYFSDFYKPSCDIFKYYPLINLFSLIDLPAYLSIYLSICPYSRAKGELITPATWMRSFVTSHPAYKQVRLHLPKNRKHDENTAYTIFISMNFLLFFTKSLIVWKISALLMFQCYHSVSLLTLSWSLSHNFGFPTFLNFFESYYSNLNTSTTTLIFIILSHYVMPSYFGWPSDCLFVL